MAIENALGKTYRAREKTWGGFTHLIRYFIAHMALILVGLYLVKMTDYNEAGVLCLVTAGLVMIYGAISTPRASRRAPHVPEL